MTSIRSLERAAAAAASYAARLAVAVLLLILSPGLATAQALDYGRNPSPLFQIESAKAGSSPGHALSFSVFRGELETYRVRVGYPDGFRFNGFNALGPVNTRA